MPLRRSDSAKTTLSMYVHRSNKFQRLLGSFNVLSLLGSLCLIFSGLVLKLSYYMDQLDFISFYFSLLPNLFLGVGVATFLLSAVGFLFSTTEQRSLILVYGYVVGLLCLFQIFTVFVAMESRREIDGDAIKTNARSPVVMGYNKINDSTVRDQWDYLQSRLRCCGAFGYTDYTSQLSGFYNCVPDSCCFNYGVDAGVSCTQSLVTKNNACVKEPSVAKSIYIRGCVDILSKLYRDDLKMFMLIYSIFGTFLAFAELTAVALSCAFAAQIHRRRKREWAPGEVDVTGGGGGGVSGGQVNTMRMDDFDQ